MRFFSLTAAQTGGGRNSGYPALLAGSTGREERHHPGRVPGKIEAHHVLVKLQRLVGRHAARLALIRAQLIFTDCLFLKVLDIPYVFEI